ncbi:MAG: CAP domain-containing protein, partial [Acidobacteria bacterium]|nr:CAP domain-containing protein [Acidobacteriota bacterium]
MRPLSVVVALAALLSFAPAPPSAAAGTATVTPGEFETCLLEKINDARAAVGARRLIMAGDTTGDTRAWSRWMAYNTFRHTTTSERYAILPDGAFTAGENIAWWSGHDCTWIHTEFMNSSDHRANILNKKWRYVAIGVYS